MVDPSVGGDDCSDVWWGDCSALYPEGFQESNCIRGREESGHKCNRVMWRKPAPA